MNITIIGCGVSGLTCGVRLAEAGYNVRILARELPPNTTSNVAAAVWYPYKAFPEDRVLAWAALSYQVFDELLHEPHAGVTLVEGVELFPYPVGDPWWISAVPWFRRARSDELPAGFVDGYVFAAHVIEMDRYLPYLMRRFEHAGGTIEQRTVNSLAEITDAPIVVNCVGLGARELVGDTTLVPIRGQIVRVAQTGVSRFTFDDHGPGGVTYIVPRSNDIILGGTAEQGRELLAPEPAIAAAITERCVALEPRLRDATLLEHRVGLRPGRPSVRLERETASSGATLVHNYGHGGAGVTLSWGCASEVVNEVLSAGR